MKFLSVGRLAIFIALLSLSCVVVVAQYPIRPYSPQEEAEYIVLKTNEDLLPDPVLVSKLAKLIVQIRKDSEEPAVRKMRNQGAWYLGRVRLLNFSPALKQKIEQSEYGPLKEVKISKRNKQEADLIFTKPFHPMRLSKRLHQEFGAQAAEIWYDRAKVPDLGDISYDIGKGEVVFADNPVGGDYSTFGFKVDEATGKAKMEWSREIGK